MGPFLRGFEMRKSTIATITYTHSFTHVSRKYNGKRWLHESGYPRNGHHESVPRGTKFWEETDVDQLEEGNDINSDEPQARRLHYLEKHEKRNPYRDTKTFFKTPEWMKPTWSKQENLKDWWIGKDTTEKSQSQEAYGDIYPLEIPASRKQDKTSDESDVVSLIKEVGVGVPINLHQQRILLKEAKRIVEYKHVLRALRQRDPHELLKALSNLSAVNTFGVNNSPLLDIPPNTFSEILRLLDPKHFFGRHKELLKDFSHRDLLDMRIDTIDDDGTHRAYTVYLWHLHRIIIKRRQKHSMYLSDYKMLLKAAKFTGYQAVADLTWKSLISNQSQVMENRRILPDVECFNYYIATMCWSDILSPFHYHRLKVVPQYKAQRQWEVRPHQLNRHRLGSNNGIKLSVSRLFREMSKTGLIGNEETFCLLLVSASREGDLETAGTILNRVWQIDIESNSSNNSKNSKLNNLLPDSPLHPSQRLIRTVVHIYCINNDLPTAIRVMDQISRKFSIEISIQTWQDLLRWTSFFARKKGNAVNIEKGFAEGLLPPASMSQVWENMISEPYNVKPTLSMYNIYIRHLLKNRQIGKAQVQIVEAHRLHIILARKVDRYRILFENSLTRRKFDSTITSIRQRDFIFHRLKLRISRMYMRLWLNHLIFRPGHYLTKYHADWAFREVPNLVRKYKSFLRGKLAYPTYTGHVLLDTGKQEETRLRIWRRRYGDMRSKRRRRRKCLGILLKKRGEYRYNRNRIAAGGRD